jgi:hypothetical protein
MHQIKLGLEKQILHIRFFDFKSAKENKDICWYHIHKFCMMMNRWIKSFLGSITDLTEKNSVAKREKP